jgi:hypothetical protein
MNSRASLLVSSLVLLGSIGCTPSPSGEQPGRPLARYPAAEPARGAVCAEFVLCTGTCREGDRTCVAECASGASASASTLAGSLLECVTRAGCGGDEACAQQRCPREVSACVAHSAEG